MLRQILNFTIQNKNFVMFITALIYIMGVFAYFTNLAILLSVILSLCAIVGIFKNHGIDKETGKRVKENVIHDFFDEIDDLMGYEGASEVIFVPEEYGLDKEATIQEIVDYILENQNIG